MNQKQSLLNLIPSFIITSAFPEEIFRFKKHVYQIFVNEHVLINESIFPDITGKKQIYPICSQYTLSVPPENIRKP